MPKIVADPALVGGSHHTIHNWREGSYTARSMDLNGSRIWYEFRSTGTTKRLQDVRDSGRNWQVERFDSAGVGRRIGNSRDAEPQLRAGLAPAIGVCDESPVAVWFDPMARTVGAAELAG